MRDGWKRVPLGDVVTTVKRPVAVQTLNEVPFAGVRWYAAGVYHRDTVEAASVKTKTLQRLETGDIVYNRMWATKASFGVAGPDVNGCLVTNDFPIFSADAAHTSSDYVGLLFQWERFQKEASLSATGTTERRRLHERDFSRIVVPLPPLEEQRRIVDLVGALDDTVAAAETGIGSGEDARGPMIKYLLAGDEDWPVTALGDLGRFVRGKRFTKSEYVESGLGCIHYGQVHTSFGTVARRPLTYLPTEARSRLRLASPGDVVIAATSENVEDLGKATVWMGEDQVAVHDDCYIFKHELEPVFASYLFRSPAFQDQKLQFAAGTKVTRISGDNLARVRLPIPPTDVQKLIADTLNASEVQTEAVRVELDRLRSLRSNLLTALLSGEHEIPESYDELMEKAAS